MRVDKENITTVNMERTIKDIDCRKSLYRNVLPNVHQELCRRGRIISIRGVYKALDTGDEEVELLFWQQVAKVEREAEERKAEIARLRSQSHNGAQAVS